MNSNKSTDPRDFTRDEKTNVVEDAQKALNVLLSITAIPDYANKDDSVRSNDITLK